MPSTQAAPCLRDVHSAHAKAHHEAIKSAPEMLRNSRATSCAGMTSYTVKPRTLMPAAAVNPDNVKNAKNTGNTATIDQNASDIVRRLANCRPVTRGMM